MKNCPICGRKYSDEMTSCEFDGSGLVAVPPTQDPMVGKVLNGRYRLINKIGRGSMSDVYVAEQIGIARNVAVKILAEEFSRDEACNKRFQQEARIVSTLDHPNLIRIFDFDQTDGNSLYIVTEFLQGKTLKDILSLGPVEIANVLRFAVQIADGLAAVHQAGIIHRDLNTNNVIVTDHDRMIKITEFGLAQLRETEAVAKLTQAGTVLGSPEYMSPEQIDGRDTDERTDIYSLGIVIYEMLCKTTPFSAATPAAVWMKHLNDEPIAPTRLRPETPAELEQIILRALQKKPEQRWARMSELAEALRKTEQTPSQPSTSRSVGKATLPNASPPAPAEMNSPATVIIDRTNPPPSLAKGESPNTEAPPHTVFMESIQANKNAAAAERPAFEPERTGNETVMLTQTIDVSEHPGSNWKNLGIGAGALLTVAGILWFVVYFEPPTVDQKSAPVVNGVQPTVGNDKTAPRLAALSIDTEKTELTAGERTTLRITGQYDDGSRKLVTDPNGVNWMSSNAAIATIDSQGIVEAKKIGRADLRARYLGLETAPLAIVIKAPTTTVGAETKLLALTIKAARQDLIVSDRLMLQATGRYSDNRQAELKTGIRWESSDREIASVSESGSVIGRKPGRVELVARFGAVASEPLTLLVKAAPAKKPTDARPTQTPPVPKSINAADLLRTARGRLDRGEYSEALRELESASKIDPSNKEIQAAILDTKRACNAERKLGRGDLKC